ncbi:hypothetical protein, partial [Enterobacter hormaechei]|uniref:hypothetical protein n=1 Tax=Enterobacter hormaechei TaxID=158836 RepID=UPI001954BABE
TDVRLWIDGAGANPAQTLRDVLGEHIRVGDRIGVEYASATLNAQRGKLVDLAFADTRLEDASELIGA